MTDLPPLDLEQARRYFAVLTGVEAPLVCWQMFPDSQADKKTPERARELTALRHVRLDASLNWAVSMNDAGAGVFTCVNLTDGTGRSSETICQLRALFVDCDGTQPLPTTWPLAPSIITQRGEKHWHAYWLLQPGESDLQRFKPAQVQLACYWIGDTTVIDLPRVMRVPGFLHRKEEPKPVQLRHAERTLYTIDQVLAAHLVDYAALSEPYRRAAEHHGLVAKATPPAPAPSPRPAAAPLAIGSSQYDRVLKATHGWMLRMDTTAGAGNARGKGRDTAAFLLARKCMARGLHRGDIEMLVSEYMSRAGGPERFGPADVDRIVNSADKAGPAYDDTPLAIQQPGGGGHRHGSQRQSPAVIAEPSDDIMGDPDQAQTPTPDIDDEMSRGGGGHGGDGRGGGGGSAGGEPPKAPWVIDLDISLTCQRWKIESMGVWPIEQAEGGEWKPRPNKRVADLPIWPVQQGRDVATGNAYWRVAWLTPHHARREQWLPELDLKTGPALIGLSDAPVTKKTCEACATWLTAARVAVRAEACSVTSRLGWCGQGDARQWVWPTEGADGVQYIGSELGEVGHLEAWRQGVDHLSELQGELNRPALVVLGFAAGTGFARIAGRRNPIVGCMGTSSTGKGSIIDYALSIWGRVDGMRVPASSTAKGLQDLAAGIPDLPVLLDEFQQLAEAYPNQAADALYYLANGQRRVTSSKDQKAKGGERRYGCGFYAAEAPVLGGMNTGVHFRVIELTDVAFCPDKQTAELLQRCTKEGGAIATQMADHLNATPVAHWKTILATYTTEWQAKIARDKGDDATALAILQAGLEALGSVLDVDLRPKEVCQWLAEMLTEQRKLTADREAVALFALFDVVLNGHWMEEDGTKDSRRDVQKGRDGLLVAWRTLVTDKDVWEEPSEGQTAVDVGTNGEVKRYRVGALDVNTKAPEPMRVLDLYGGEQRVMASWAKRGWISPDPDGHHLKVKKWHGGAPIGRVARFSPTGLQAYYDWKPPVVAPP